MWNLAKKYWDLLGGVLTGIGLSLLAKFKLGKIQLIYSIIILVLVCIGMFKIFRQSIDKYREKKPRRTRKKNVVDAVVDTRQEMKAINIAQNPMQPGEELGAAIIQTVKGGKKLVKKLKVMFNKFKGYLLASALGIMSVIEMFGGYINSMFGDKLTVGGVDIVSVIVLVCAIVVAGVSNGGTKESKSSSNELVTAEVKKTLKEDEALLKEKNKQLEIKETELDNLEGVLTSAKNKYEAKVKMSQMTPKLATDEDVANANNGVLTAEKNIINKKAEIDDLTKEINGLTATIEALKSQL